ncbi:hypothetical protein BDW74DRAFT_177912 [Aspergillus multicolor]|uniref:uncharacterized protein n=1 Tax=Aspergillus multicolor TaxID=41759 RepID=UPI003CCE016A
MKFIAPLFSAAALAGLAAAVPQATTTSTSTSTPTPSPTPTGPSPRVTIYENLDFTGDSVSFEPSQACQTLFPWIESVQIPEDEGIYCQFFDNDECSGEGGPVIIESISEVDDEDTVYPGIICDVLF